MKRKFWGGELEILESDFNNRVENFFNELKTCFISVIGKSFENLSSIDGLHFENFEENEELRYFFSWLKEEGLTKIKSIADFGIEKADSELEQILDSCAFILEDTIYQEDKEIACDNIADAIMYLSKAVTNYNQNTVEYSDIPSDFKIKTKLANSNFEIIETDLIFEDEIFPLAA